MKYMHVTIRPYPKDYSTDIPYYLRVSEKCFKNKLRLRFRGILSHSQCKIKNMLHLSIFMEFTSPFSFKLFSSVVYFWCRVLSLSCLWNLWCFDYSSRSFKDAKFLITSLILVNMNQPLEHNPPLCILVMISNCTQLQNIYRWLRKTIKCRFFYSRLCLPGDSWKSFGLEMA